MSTHHYFNACDSKHPEVEVDPEVYAYLRNIVLTKKLLGVADNFTITIMPGADDSEFDELIEKRVRRRVSLLRPKGTL